MVEKGIQDTIAEVPAERVINAVPFYTRLWKTEAGTLSSEAIGMDTAQEVVNTNNAQVYWDSDVSQNYGSFEKDGCTYRSGLRILSQSRRRLSLCRNTILQEFLHGNLDLKIAVSGR